MLHFFFSKGFDFRSISQDDVDFVIYLLNNRPRKCLDWHTSVEIFFANSVTLTWQSAIGESILWEYFILIKIMELKSGFYRATEKFNFLSVSFLRLICMPQEVCLLFK